VQTKLVTPRSKKLSAKLGAAATDRALARSGVMPD